MSRTRLRSPAAVSSETLSRSAPASGPTVMRPFSARTVTPSRTFCWMSRAIVLKRISHRHLHADLSLHFFYSYHFYGVPGAAIEESAVRALAGALLTADAQDRVDLDVAEGRMVLVGHPIHAVGHGAVGHAGGRSGAPGATLRDDGEFLGPLLPRGSD